jgi:DNA polymerase-3 subunit gamma/tau
VAHQSLYRRYRPRNFAELKGQEHVVTALRNAVADDSAAHAYMFSGPRGTGKTSAARIFAKALNCTSLNDGEPCRECESCLSIKAGTSFDLFELDAASNRGVDDMRELVERTMVASPGRTKVYILDEVHMLTPAASNTLLKTLEEPPEHVRFVLATTDPQKVLPTIRSRTQHFEFRLLSTEQLTDHARWVAADAELEVDETSIAYAVKQGRGSMRDMLSALDQVVAAGGVFERPEPVEELFSALADGAEGSGLVAVADAIADGHDPRVLAEAFVAEVRDAFLLSIGVDSLHLVDSDRERLGGWAEKLGSAGLSRAMERIGSALVDMRSAADPRVPLEVALIQLAAPSSAAPSPSHGVQSATTGHTGSGSGAPSGSAEVLELRNRVERLEKALADQRVVSTSRQESAGGDATGREPVIGDEDSTSAGPAQGAVDPTTGSRGTGARAALSRTGRSKPPPPPPRRSRSGAPADQRPSARPASAPEETAADSPPPPEKPIDEPVVPAARRTGSGIAPATMPDRDSLVMAFGDSVVPKLKGIAKAIFSNGRFVSVTGDHAVFAVENAPTRDRAERYRAEVESLLAAEFAAPVPLRLVVEGEDCDASGPGSSSAAEPRDGGHAAGSSRPATADVAGSDGSGDAGQGVGTDRTGVSTPAPVHDASGDDEAEIMAEVSELEDADVHTSTVDRLTSAFPGAELIEPEETT